MQQVDDPFTKYGGKEVNKTSSEDPFSKYGGAEIKKKVSTSVSPSTLPSLPAGSELIPSSPANTDLTPVLPQYRDAVRQQSMPNGSGPSPSGMMPVKLVKPARTPIQQFTQTNGAVRKDKSWENLGDFVPKTVMGGLDKDAGQALEFLGRNLPKSTQPLLNKQQGDKLAQIGLKLEGWGQEHLDQAQQHQLPNTTGGNLTSTAVGFAPTMLELALTPELDVAKLGKLGDVLAKYGGKYAPKAANVLGGKFPVLMGAKGLTSGYDEAKANGASDYDAMKDALVKSGEEYGKGVLFEGAGKAASKVSDIGKKLLEDKGWMAGGKILSTAQKAILNSSAQATAFSAVPFITNAVQGKSTSMQEIKDNAIFGGVLGLFHGDEPGKDSDKPSAAEGSAKEIQERSPLIDMHHFMSADMDAIKYAHNLKENPVDLQMKAATHAQDAFENEDPETKQQQAVQSSINGKLSSVKSVTNAILKNKEAVIDAVPDIPEKQQIIDKINAVHKELDPTEQAKTALGNQISDIDNQLAAIPKEETDPVRSAENEVKTETLTKQREELNNQLKQTILKQQENESTNEDEKRKADEEKSNEGGNESEESSQNGEKNDVTPAGGDETSPVTNQQDNAIQEQSTGKVDVQSKASDGEKVGEGDTKSEKSAKQSEESSKNEKPRYKIKGDVITRLPIAEHSELNTILKQEDGIDISHLKDVHEQERNAGGEQDKEAPANAEAVQQPENDGAGNAGENRPGESSETAKGAAGKATFKKATGIRNEDVETERGENIPRITKSREDTDTEGRRLVDSGELNPDEFAKKVIAKPYPASTEEQAALRYHKVNLEKEQRKLSKEPTPENTALYARNEDRLEQNRKATEIIGNETARTLGDRQGQMAEDYSRIHILERAKIANGGELDPKDEKELTERTNHIKELEGKLADREEQIRKLQDTDTVAKVKKVAERQERDANRAVTKASLRKEREDLFADLHLIARKSMKSAGANKIPVEMIVPLTKLARNYVLDGINTISGVADKIYSDLKDHLPGIDRSDIELIIKDGFDKSLAEHNAIRLERSKKLQQKKLEALKNGTYEQRVYSKIQVDNDYLAIRADINREQQKINKKIADIEQSQKSITRKAVDFAVKYGRQLKLASISVLGKLSAAGLTTVGIEPVNEGIGKGVSKLLPKLAKKAYGQGSVSRSALQEASSITEGNAVNSLSQAYARAATKGMKDAYNELKLAGSDLSALYGKDGKLPPEAAEFFGHLHSAIKAPIKRFTWEKSYARRVAKTIENGLDPLDPVIDARNRVDAYKDAERSIFMGDNWLSSQYENVTGAAEKSKFSSVRTTGAIARILFPFVKVPTNIVLETARYAGGLIPGLGKVTQIGASALAKKAGAEGLARMIHTGMGELTPEESDIVLRNLKRGSVGAAALAVGFFNPKAVGGYYQPGEKRKPNEANADSFMIDGHKVPMWVTEHPIFQAMQVGATFRRLLEAHKNKDDKYEAAFLGTAAGISQNIPLAEGAKQITEALGGSKKLNTYVANVIKGETEPAFLQQLATVTDTRDHSLFSFDGKNQVQRAPDKKHGFKRMLKQTLEMGIPGLRKDVPRHPHH